VEWPGPRVGLWWPVGWVLMVTGCGEFSGTFLEKLLVVGDLHSAVEIGHISEPTTLFEQTLSNHKNRLDKGRPGNVYGGCHCIELSKRI
jgi:hypothetical protein